MLFSTTFFAQPDIELDFYVGGFSSPVDIVNAGDDRLFIVERSGTIKIVDATGTTLSTNFLNIDNKVVNTGGQSEKGLLGLAFHPDYTNNGFFYVRYTNNSSNSILARYSVDSSNPNIADANSEVIIMEVDQPFGNHNGGGLKFGPDGYLYIGLGDGGSANDPGNRSQNPQTLLGKMLRIDIDNGSPYSIPADNPFVNDANVLDEIWALGLRNPWRYSFDRETGDLWMGDVGQGDWEEIDYQPASSTGGENYGWRCYEGNHNFNTSGCGPATDYVGPVFEYEQGGFSGPCSVTGGFVYRGTESPDLVGHYIVADYCTGDFWTVSSDGAGGWIGQEAGSFPGYDISTFGEDIHGELYVARMNGGGNNNGNIYKIKSNLCASLDMSISVTNPCEGQNNGSIEIAAAGGLAPYTYGFGIADPMNIPPGTYTATLEDANGCLVQETYTIETLPLPTQPTIAVNDNELTTQAGYSIYQWLLNGSIIPGATNEIYTITESGAYSVQVTGSNGCSIVSDVTNATFTTDVENIPTLRNWVVTPNPFQNIINVEIIVMEKTDLEIELTDIAGKIIFTKKINVQNQSNQSIDTEQLEAGVYFINLRSEKGVASRKVVKN